MINNPLASYQTSTDTLSFGFNGNVETNDKRIPSGINAGAIGYGGGGPRFLDAFHTKRPPTPIEIIDAFKGVAYSCIQLNALGVSRVPIRLMAVRRKDQKAPRRFFRKASDEQQKRIRFSRTSIGLSRSIDSHDEIDEILDHALLESLEKPNEYFDKQTFFMYMVACLDAIGSSFLYPTRPVGSDGLNDPSVAIKGMEVWPLQPQFVYPVKGSNDQVLGSWRYFGDTFANKEIIRIRHTSLRDPYLSGYAPLHAAYEQASLVDYYTASMEGILKGGARPETVISPKDNLFRFGPDERERFEGDINQKYTAANKGKVWVLDGAFDLKSLTFPPVDLGGNEITKENRLLIANAMGVPISLLQDENSNRATAQESKHAHEYYAIDPRCRMISAALTKQFAQPVDDRLFFMFDNCVSRDKELDARVWAMKLDSGAAYPNEWRNDDQEPPVEWGEEPFIASGKVQPSIAKSNFDSELDLKKPTEDGKPEETATESLNPGSDVQAQALNGAQISSLVEVIKSVKEGVIPPESAVALLIASFPGLATDTINKMIDPIEIDTPEQIQAKIDAQKPHTFGGKLIEKNSSPSEEKPISKSASVDDRMIRLMDTMEGFFRLEAIDESGNSTEILTGLIAGDPPDTQENESGSEHVQSSAGQTDSGRVEEMDESTDASSVKEDTKEEDSSDSGPQESV